MGTQEGREGTLVGSGSRGSPSTLEPVQKEVRKLPHSGPSLGLPLFFLPRMLTESSHIVRGASALWVPLPGETENEITCNGAVTGSICLRMCNWSLGS